MKKLKSNGITITNINSEKLKISEESINAFIEVNIYKLKSRLLNDFMIKELILALYLL